MNSRKHRPRNQLDRLIHQALVDSVRDEEPPAHVWDRIRAELTTQPRRPSLHWSAAVLQAALLIVIAVFGGTLIWQEQWVEQSVLPRSPASSAGLAMSYADRGYSHTSVTTARVWTLAVFGDEAPEQAVKSTAVAMDSVELAVLQRYATRPHPANLAADQGPALRPARSRVDVSSETSSLRAKMQFLRSLRRVESTAREIPPAEPPVYAPGPMWQ